LRDFDLFVAARKIADLVHSYPNDQLWMLDRRNAAPNPYYKQTESGLFLEMYYGLPSRLWTPWGEWHFGGSGSGDWDPVHPVILARLGATEYQPEMGYIGPVYAIHRVDGDITLPDPIVRPHEQYMSYKDALAAWEQMTARYQQAHA